MGFFYVIVVFYNKGFLAGVGSFYSDSSYASSAGFGAAAAAEGIGCLTIGFFYVIVVFYSKGFLAGVGSFSFSSSFSSCFGGGAAAAEGIGCL